LGAELDVRLSAAQSVGDVGVTGTFEQISAAERLVSSV
jgi:hypothetical protein